MLAIIGAIELQEHVFTTLLGWLEQLRRAVLASIEHEDVNSISVGRREHADRIAPDLQEHGFQDC